MASKYARALSWISEDRFAAGAGGKGMGRGEEMKERGGERGE